MWSSSTIALKMSQQSPPRHVWFAYETFTSDMLLSFSSSATSGSGLAMCEMGSIVQSTAWLYPSSPVKLSVELPERFEYAATLVSTRCTSTTLGTTTSSRYVSSGERVRTAAPAQAGAVHKFATEKFVFCDLPQWIPLRCSLQNLGMDK